MAKNWMVGLIQDKEDDDSKSFYGERIKEHSTAYLLLAVPLNLIKLALIALESLLSWFVIYPAIFFLNFYLIKDFIALALDSITFFMFGNFLLVLFCLAYFSYQLFLPFLIGENDLTPHDKAVARMHIIGYALIMALIAHNKELSYEKLFEQQMIRDFAFGWGVYFFIYLIVKLFFRAAHHK